MMSSQIVDGRSICLAAYFVLFYGAWYVLLPGDFKLIAEAFRRIMWEQSVWVGGAMRCITCKLVQLAVWVSVRRSRYGHPAARSQNQLR